MAYVKGQGATEYLVLLAVVLIIALVSIALLGFFPGLATDARITQSNSYWRGEARPFQIIEHTAPVPVDGATNITMVMQNSEAQGTVTLENISIAAAGGVTSHYTAAPISFAPGESKTVMVAISGGTVSTATAGTIYDLPVNITYDTPTGVRTVQYGVKNIVGKYG